MCKIIIAFTISFFTIFHLAAQAPGKEAEFKRNLSEMYNRTSKTAKLIREQITQNQHAPFLADLYLELAEVLSQKANVIYYIKMEKENLSETTAVATKALDDVVEAQKEAISVYEKILKEFPNFDKKSRTMYMLALSLKSIDEIPTFINVAKQLVVKYPNEKEAMRAQLLLGDHYFTAGKLADAQTYYFPLVNSTHVYERNLARYKMGLIYIMAERYNEALAILEKLITDEELKETDNQFEVSLKQKEVKSNLKREALIDSIRAYTNVYKVNPDPVGYYSKIAPTENLFQETIEKLAFRYITLKRFDLAIKLLRTLSERTIDVQKIINVYQEVLLMIPINDRINLPVEEIQFLLEKYALWSNYFRINKKTLDASYAFFEKQVRDLGTRSHEMAKIFNKSKVPQDKEKRDYFAEKAISFYLLYLGFFDKSPNSAKVAMNLADVYYQKQDYVQSGDYYLRVYKGEFGPVAKKHEYSLIQNALLCLQKNKDYSFYELVRGKGLLIEAMSIYIASNAKNKNDPKLNFILAKSRYEQGFYDQAVVALLEFIQKFKKTKYAVDAGNLILDYYNTKSDYGELANWANKILAQQIPDKSFNQKVEGIKKQAQLKSLQAQVESFDEYDSFSQGKTYLKAAMQSSNEQIMTMALQKALASSKKEKDLETFFNTAQLMAKQEPSPKKSFSIMQSMAQENVKITRYYRAINDYQELIGQSKFDPALKRSAFSEVVNIATTLRDWRLIYKLTKSDFGPQVSGREQTQLLNQVIDVLESPVRPPSEVYDVVSRLKPTDELLLAVYKAQTRSPSGAYRSVRKQIETKCARKKSTPVCRWYMLESLEKAAISFAEDLAQAPPHLESIEKKAGFFQMLLKNYEKIANSSDPHLEIVVALKNASLYRHFGDFLTKVAANNPQVKNVLHGNVQQSYAASENYFKKCRQIIKVNGIITPANRFCLEKTNPPLIETLTYKQLQDYPAINDVDDDQSYQEDRKNIFVSNKTADRLLDIAEKYYQNQITNYALAAAMYGSNYPQANQKNLNAIIGCSVFKLGHYNEAKYYLNSANDYKGMKTKCLGEIAGLEKKL